MPMDLSVVPTFILGSDGLFREGLRLILSKTPFRPLACGAELDDLADVPTDKPILFVVGIIGQPHDFLCKRIRSRHPSAIIMAVGDQQHQVAQTLVEGANAALLSSVTPNALVAALHALVNGKLVVIDSRVWSCEISRTAGDLSVLSVAPENPIAPIQIDPAWAIGKEHHDTNQLSAREIAILKRIVKGDSNKHVARFFGIAEPTVKAHVKAIFRKIGASNRTEAAIWAVKNQLIDNVEESHLAAKV